MLILHENLSNRPELPEMNAEHKEGFQDRRKKIASNAMHELLAALHLHRGGCGPTETVGLSDAVLERFLLSSGDLQSAITEALSLYPELSEFSCLSEQEVIRSNTAGFCVFYPSVYRQPFVPVAARGSWVVTLHGAVLNDAGGYGMMGLGHSPASVVAAMGKPVVMGNIITPSLSHGKFIKAMRSEIGHTRDSCPYDEFLLMNSGSEANSVVDRIMDSCLGHLAYGSTHAASGSTTQDAVFQSEKEKKTIVMKGGFHGRTFAPAVWTESSSKNYQKHKCARILKAKTQEIIVVELNNVAELIQAFATNEVGLVVLEGVMGEGNPGVGVTAEFYKTARELCDKYNAFILVDSVQAGYRTHGVLSITDYPGFGELSPPDFEVFSKAINAGQYPVSVVAMTKRAASWHKPGIYGNTMTGNPRACEVVVAVVKAVTNELRENVKDVGKYAVEKFTELKKEFPVEITHVTGTGLLYAVHLNKDAVGDVVDNGVERWMRVHGIGVIHGGENALRFTPPFNFTHSEVDLQVDTLRACLRSRPDSVLPLKVEISKNH